MNTTLGKTLLAILLLTLAAPAARATQIRNVVDIKGSEQSPITGLGLVVGLNGTGDSEFSSAHRMLLNAIREHVDATALPADLSNSQSLALVVVRAVIPKEGVRAGVDRLDVSVAAVNDAESLKGGMLLDAVLFGPGVDGEAFAVASGDLMLPDEEGDPLRARIVRGAHMLRDVPAVTLDEWNRIHLVLHESKASWELSNYIAMTINGLLAPDGDPVATAVDQKNVIVQVPDFELQNVASFINQILVTTIDAEAATGGAKVIINRAEGSIVMTGDVELSPVIISHKGMTIQIVTPEPEPDPNRPRIEEANFLALDPENRGGPRLRQLLDALNTLNVPADDRIAIIKEIHDLGVLHAELEYK